MKIRYLSGKGFTPTLQNSVWTHIFPVRSFPMQLRCVLSMHCFQRRISREAKLVPSESEEFVARFRQVWKCIEITNPCCSSVQPLRFMHFRNLHNCLFKCRNYWVDCLTFRTFLSSCPAKIFQQKTPEIPAFQKPSSPLFSSAKFNRNLRHHFYLPERFVNLHHKSPRCFSPNV